MARDAGDTDGPSRREYLLSSGAVLGGGLLAGCAGNGSEGTATEPATDSQTNTPTEARTETATPVETPYTVEMAPMGEVQFEAVPERWMAYFSTYGDMAIALGQLEGLEALIFTDNWPLEFFEYLPDVEVDFSDVEQLFVDGGIDKETFYAVDADVHLLDPNFIQLLDDNWEDDDFAEVATNIGPIIGNSSRRRGEDWHDYRYYPLYEAFEKISQVFKAEERFSALESVHDEFISRVQADLPAESERPAIGLLSVNSDFENGSFYAYPVHDGNGHKQYRDLGMKGAFEEHIDGSYAQWDYEQLLEVDPDILVFQYGFSHVSTEEFESRMEAMREDPVGRKLSAVQNDRLYRGGTSYQGPLINLFQTEAAAKQFYPDAFGEWNGFETLEDSDAHLFDHQRVADIVNGDV